MVYSSFGVISSVRLMSCLSVRTNSNCGFVMTEILPLLLGKCSFEFSVTMIQLVFGLQEHFGLSRHVLPCRKADLTTDATRTLIKASDRNQLA